HMLFKGTTSRSAEAIAQEADSIGGQIDASTGKENANYSIKVLDEHLSQAVDILSDLVLHPRFAPEDVEKEKSVVIEEIKMVEDMPDDLVHELFLQGYWKDHPLGRPILGTPDSVASLTADALREYFRGAYTADQLVVTVAGNAGHPQIRDLVERAFGQVAGGGSAVSESAPTPAFHAVVRTKDLEQSHVCLGVASFPHRHPDRYAALVLNTVLGGSMSSRLFQHVREKRGLAYSVGSGLSAFRDAGVLSIYAGCANEKVEEVVRVVMSEVQEFVRTPVPADELQRAQDNVKGGLLLGLESTWHRAAYLARQELYFDQAFDVEEILAGIARVSVEDVSRVAHEMLAAGPFSLAVLGDVKDLAFTAGQLQVTS
ncbi:MAG: pitrilysin family protein, partial [Vicinamibacterales bacterium]|nr:pitrilysin family protein [Vicinamibacterales bacterium]